MATQSQQEAQNMLRLREEQNKDRASRAVDSPPAKEKSPNATPKDQKANKVKFPVGMMLLAAGFDIVGFIPLVNFISEPIAAITFGIWQKKYQDATLIEVLIAIVGTKTADFLLVGLAPSSTGIVLYAYLKKKSQNVL